MCRFCGCVATLLLILVASGFVPKATKSVSAATGNSCITEINAGTVIDVACVIPASVGKKYTVELWAKRGDENSGGWNWRPCTVGGQGRCQEVPAGWTPPALVPETGGLEAVQSRFVPDANAGALRARMKVSY
jgi:hypothetical protein